MASIYEVYQSVENSQYYWALWKDRYIIATGHQAFATDADARAAIDEVKSVCATSPVAATRRR